MSISPRILFTSKGAVAPVINLPARTQAIETVEERLMVHVNSSGYLGANVVGYFPVFVPVKCKIDGIIMKIGTPQGNIDVGVYNSAGSKLVSSGSIGCPATGYARIGLAETVLSIGWCILAFVANSGATFFFVPAASTGLPSGYQDAGTQSGTFPLPAQASITWGNVGKFWMRLVHS